MNLKGGEMMFEYEDLDYVYNLQKSDSLEEVSMDMKTGYDDTVRIHNYHINKDAKKGPLEHFSIYSTGLVIFVRQYADKIYIYSNKEFRLEDDGIFYLVE